MSIKMNHSRAKEIYNSFASFSKNAYHRTEILPELFALQTELVEKTFPENTQAEDLRIWDVEKRLDEINAECGGIVTGQLNAFKKDCKYICNLIKANVSGSRGEMKAFDSLSRIRSEHIILKNIELSNAEMRSELDAVVITHSGVFIVEVKNISRSVFIDENGNLYKTGEFLKKDSNIGEKMLIKKNLLRQVLNAKGLVDLPIYEIVVFTNNSIEIQNKCKTLKTCFLSQLPHIIDNCRSTVIFSSEMDLAARAINGANIEKLYPFELDMVAFKMNFATILVALEEAAATKQHNRLKVLVAFFLRKTAKCARVAAALAIALVTAIGSVNSH